MAVFNAGLQLAACPRTRRASGDGWTSSRVSTIGLILFSAMTLIACNGDGLQHESLNAIPDVVVDNPGPERDSRLTVGEVRYPLNSAIGDIWGESDDHFLIDFTFINGNFEVATVVSNRQTYEAFLPAQATAVFHARVFSVGTRFEHISYGFVANSEGRLPGVGYFTDAYVGLDTDQSGSIENTEKLMVIEGTLNFTGNAQDFEMNLSVSLSNGQSVEGEYSGLIEMLER